MLSSRAMSDHFEQDNDDSTFEGPESVTGDEHPDGIVGPERETPADAVPDDEQTAEDLADSGVNLGDPTYEPSDFTVSVIDHEVTVDVDGVSDDAEPDEPTDDELDRLARSVADERAVRASRRAARPFEHVDKESLLVLQNQLRTELAYR